MNANPLNYAGPSTPVWPIGAAAVTITIAVAAGVIALWCGVHTVHVWQVQTALANSGPICGNAITERLATLGLPIEKTIPIGFLAGGVSLVAVIQSIRLMNAGRVV